MYGVLILITKDEIHMSDDLRYIPLNQSYTDMGINLFYTKVDRNFTSNVEALSYMKSINSSRKPLILLEK